MKLDRISTKLAAPFGRAPARRGVAEPANPSLNSHARTSLKSALARVALCGALGGLLYSPAAVLANGVSDERVSLPDGPGSIGGVGSNVELDVNMGLASHSIPIELPEGHAEATPSLALSYSSGGGSGLLGLGWDLQIGSIERMTQRGLPAYDSGDEFVADGSTQLVQVADEGGVLIYRARREGSFARYEWHAVGDGSEGYWVVRHSDGRIGYYGADAKGNLADTARLAGPSGQTFRYEVVEEVDTFGNRIVYSYAKPGEVPLIDAIEYGFSRDGDARFSVHFDYEDRPDHISNCMPGFETALTRRPAAIKVHSLAEVIRTYRIDYQDDAAAGGVSRIAGVSRYGRNGDKHPIEFTFGYSGALGGTCSGSCASPFMVDMGTLPGGVDLATGRATFIDINGDAVPDVLSTDTNGEHRFILAKPSASGRPTFEGSATPSSQTVGGSEFKLATPGVQVMDVNGDGYTDIVASRVPAVLCNDGSGDWSSSDCMADATLPVLEEDQAGDADPKNVRFFDYDNDHRIDMLRTTSVGTEVFVNNGKSFASVTVDPIGAVFDESNLQLADINGDGLQDPVELMSTGEMRYRLNLGYGHWTEWRVAALSGFSQSALSMAELQDLNGDGRDDVVVVSGVEVRYALNMSAGRFADVAVITSADVEGSVPERTAQTTVSFADMNGNGTDDVVWATSSGAVSFLELAPVRPNLMTRIENNIGSVQQIEYATSVSELAGDDGTTPWAYRLPHAMIVVSATDTWVTLTGGEDGEGLHTREELRYRDGYYDSAEKSFSGYAHVERVMVGDFNLDSQEPRLEVLTFDIGGGSDGYYYTGLEQRSQIFGGDTLDVPLRDHMTEYDDCTLSGVPKSGLRFPVRYVCETASMTVLQEGLPKAEWATTRTENTISGYGQVLVSSDLGVVHMGSPSDPKACAPCEQGVVPCGEECLGDEQIEESTYIEPGAATSDAWILDRASHEYRYGAAGDLRSETRNYYDGEDFVGLPSGKLTEGSLTRAETREVDGKNAWVQIERTATDAYGNVVAELDPLGAPDDTEGHRRSYAYDDFGLNVVRTELSVADGDGQSHGLRRDYTYEQGYNRVSEATAWMLVQGGAVKTARNSVRYRYDDFGRINAVLRPGSDEADAEYVYELGDPNTRVIEHRRSQQGADFDIEKIQCQDGLGRVYQTRLRTGSSSYLVSGFVVFNRQGQPVRAYEAYASDSGECDDAAPSGVRAIETRYDALGRQVGQTLPDADDHDSASTNRTVYEPLSVVSFDAEDSDEAGDFADTPTTTELDGLGRLVRHTRTVADGDSASVTLEYDELGQLVGLVDSAGNRHEQTFDLIGRVVFVRDPNAGEVTFDYDAAGNLIERSDGSGKRARFAYDSLGRMVAAWDADDEEATRQVYGYDVAEGCKSCTNAAGMAVSVAFPISEDGEEGGLLRYGYDVHGNTIWRGTRMEGHDLDVALTYDNADRLATRTLPDGQIMRYTYDPASRQVAIDGILDDVKYDKRGDMAAILHANGITTEIEYDAMQHVKSRKVTRGSDVLMGLSFARDRLGNVLSIGDAGPSRATSQAASFTYDAWYRVLDAEYAGVDADAEPLKLSTVYDALDNIVQVKASGTGIPALSGLGKFAYEGAGPNQVTNAGSLDYDYDGAGRVVKRGELPIHWDHQSRVVGYGEAGEADAVRHVYASGTERVLTFAGGGVSYYLPMDDFEVHDGISVTYARLHGARVAALKSDALSATLLSDVAPMGEPDAQITAGDAWLALGSEVGLVELDADADAPARLLRASARRMLLSDSDRQTHLHGDHLGSLVMATDADGEVRGERAFTAMGLTRASTGHVDPHGFAGQEQEADPELIRMGSRVLDTRIGRWLSSDPLFERISPNLADQAGESTTAYAYVGNNPVNFTDPTGTRKWFPNTRRAIANGARATVRGVKGIRGRLSGRQKRLTQSWSNVAAEHSRIKGWYAANGLKAPGKDGGAPQPSKGWGASSRRAAHQLKMHYRKQRLQRAHVEPQAAPVELAVSASNDVAEPAAAPEQPQLQSSKPEPAPGIRAIVVTPPRPGSIQALNRRPIQYGGNLLTVPSPHRHFRR